jgi:hypothetical protein
MPIYDFMDDARNERIGLYFEAMEGPDGPPAIGECIPGTAIRRIPSLPGQPVVKTYEFKGYSQPIWAEGAKRYDKDGTPVFSTRAEVDEYVAVQNGQTETDGVGQQGGEIIAHDAMD